MLVGTGLVGKRHVLLHCAGAASARSCSASSRHRSPASARCTRCRRSPTASTAMRALKGTVFGIEGDEVGRATATQARRRARRHRARRSMARRWRAITPPLRSPRTTSSPRSMLRPRYSRVRAFARRRQRRRSCRSPRARCATSPHMGTTDGLTGPVRRGDAATIQRHLDALRGRPELVEIYRALARRAVEIAARIDGPDAPDRAGLDAIRALLLESSSIATALVASSAMSARLRCVALISLVRVRRRRRRTRTRCSPARS